MLSKATMVIVLFLFGNLLFAQDTLLITSSNLKINNLKESVNKYIVYTQDSINGPKKNLAVWSRSVLKDTINNQLAWRVNQVWESTDTIVHTATGYFDLNTFKNLKHTIWWKQNNATIDFNVITGEVLVNKKNLNGKVNDPAFVKMLSDFGTASGQYFLNWHYDLEIFSMLPYKLGRIMQIPFYEPGFAPNKSITYTVENQFQTIRTSSSKKIKCWVLNYKSPQGILQRYWISTETYEIIKLEENNNGQLRFKVKLIA